ncbi:hypothetical protein T05_5466 [Trichinella murrelli]|uniref:Uncharacterized protein n=1 Tax=Trichinella murrelli TaxID=144512 RepID=A0A0V0TG35_9BILA|nr:hypothetical protein T05_5466 [Trichinella murrelli]
MVKIDSNYSKLLVLSGSVVDAWKNFPSNDSIDEEFSCGKLGATGLYFHQRFISGVVQKYQTDDGMSTITMKACPKISSHQNFPKLILKNVLL